MGFKSAAELEAERVEALREASAVARDAVLEEAALVADAKEAEMRKLGKAGEYQANTAWWIAHEIRKLKRKP